MEVKPLDKYEVYYPEMGISYLETGIPKGFISQQIRQGSKGVYKCCYEYAPECKYSVENCDTVATHICLAHMGICVECQYCPRKSWSGYTWEDHFTMHHPEITRDDHYGPPLDLAGVKFEEVDITDIQ